MFFKNPPEVFQKSSRGFSKIPPMDFRTPPNAFPSISRHFRLFHTKHDGVPHFFINFADNIRNTTNNIHKHFIYKQCKQVNTS